MGEEWDGEVIRYKGNKSFPEKRPPPGFTHGRAVDLCSLPKAGFLGTESTGNRTGTF